MVGAEGFLYWSRSCELNVRIFSWIIIPVSVREGPIFLNLLCFFSQLEGTGFSLIL